MTNNDSELEIRETAILTELLDTVTESRRLIAQHQAIEAAALAQAGHIGAARSARLSARATLEREMPIRSIAAEFGTAMHVADRTAQAQINDAMSLVDDYPETFTALHEGRISRSHVNTILNAGAPLEGAEARAQFDHDVVKIAEVETAGRLRRFADALAETAQPRTLNERHLDAREERSVRVFALPDGMAQLEARLPGILAHGIFDRITQQARLIKNVRDAAPSPDANAPSDTSPTGSALDGATGAGSSPSGSSPDGSLPDSALTDATLPDRAAERDVRTMDQIRADLLADMLLTSVPAAEPNEADGDGTLGAIRAVVQVTVPAATLAGTANIPADLAGFGPVDPETARTLAGGAAGWDRVFTHPITREVLTVDRYRPSDALKRHLRARDQHCRFPGCRTAAVRCDIDHTIDAALGGATEARNLAHLCRRHHTLKHATPWRVVQHAGGVLEWTSPAGRIYTDKPPGVMFSPSPPDDRVHPDDRSGKSSRFTDVLDHPLDTNAPHDDAPDRPLNADAPLDANAPLDTDTDTIAPTQFEGWSIVSDPDDEPPWLRSAG
ncbi:HNH endonuclease signature motif containing protein [Microbacterium marmarense]|uniref:DUF222 domain-containing protein n=1 Tax=Microbacterium marmarense TaxID=3122051 RepID=A0ABU8LXN9_9MICO